MRRKPSTKTASGERWPLVACLEEEPCVDVKLKVHLDCFV
jgi:hypothetical protein